MSFKLHLQNLELPDLEYQTFDFAGKETTLAYRQAGKQNPHTLVCLHGMTWNSAHFSSVIDEMSKTHHVIAVDLPGHGSTKCSNVDHMLPQNASQLVGQLTAKLGHGDVTVLGISYGGWVAMCMAAQMPEQIQGVVIDDISPGIDCHVWKTNAKSQKVKARKQKALLAQSGQIPGELPLNEMPFKALKQTIQGFMGWWGLTQDQGARLFASFIEYNQNQVVEEGVTPEDHPIQFRSRAKDPLGLFHLNARLFRTKLDVWSYWPEVQCDALVLLGECPEKPNSVVTRSQTDRMVEIKPGTQVISFPSPHPVPLEGNNIYAIQDFLNRKRGEKA